MADLHENPQEFRQRPVGRFRNALTGAAWAVISAFPIAAVTALLYRFPVPFSGYQSGLNAMVPALIAVLVYGVYLGGLLVVGAVGAIGGFIAAAMLQDDQRNSRLVARMWGLAVATTIVLVMAFGDQIIGRR